MLINVFKHLVMRNENRSMKLVFILMISGLLCQSCFKDHFEKQRDEEKRILEQFIKQQNITVTPTKSGLYYIEMKEGTGPTPEWTDWVEFTFTGRLVANQQTVVMTTDSLTARENSIYDALVQYGPNRYKMSTISLSGMTEGLSKMKAGGKARLIFPSDLGYGGQTVGIVPAFSSLIVDIELINVITNIDKFERSKMLHYLEDNNITDDSTSTGLIYHEIFPGTGEYPMIGSNVTFKFQGSFLNGKIFTQSDDNETFSFIVGNNQVINGVEEGVRLMKKGGKAKLIIPYYLAYGESGYVYQYNNYYYILVWPYTTLVYDLELINIQ